MKAWRGWLLLGIGHWGCSHVGWWLAQPQPPTTSVQELRASHYVLPFADENEKTLLSLTLPPGGHTNLLGILPAGSRVQLQAVQTPYAWLTRLQRMASTPVSMIWVLLQPVAAGTWLSTLPTPYVMLLDPNAHLGRDVTSQLGDFLAEEGVVSRFLAQCRPSIQTAIAHKNVVVGMQLQEVDAALGPYHFIEPLPEQKQRWRYPGQRWHIVAQHGHVIEAQQRLYEE